jgi:hypothetical protein
MILWQVVHTRWKFSVGSAIACYCVLLLGSAFVQAAAAPTASRQFHFPSDTLSFANQLVWEYELDPKTGRVVEHPRVPKPSYTLHCFSVARTARQFFDHACFDPTEPKASSASYRYLVHAVLSRGRFGPRYDREKLVIPGYASLRAFSEENEALLKAEIGGAWQSFLQRGNWRMIFPFGRRHQARTADELLHCLEHGVPPLVHLVCFPALTLNHFMLVFDSRKTDEGIEFSAYDPNDPLHPVTLTYQSSAREFWLDRTAYFLGGRVDVYQVYRGMLY